MIKLGPTSNMNAIFHKMNYNLTAIGEMELICLFTWNTSITNKSLLSLFNDNVGILKKRNISFSFDW